jgi:uncharacterized membrane protein
MASNKWIAPAVGYLFLTGIIGVTIKLALRGVKWPELVLWSAIVYAVVALVLLAFGNRAIHFDASGGWAIATGICAVLGLICAIIALRHGPAVVVVPVMSAFPVVTILASLAFLGESVSAIQALGAGLVLAGVILLSR